MESNINYDDYIAVNSKNQYIVIEFVKLINQIKYEIDKFNGNPFRLQKIRQSLNVILNYPKEIKRGSDLSDFKGIGKGTIDRIDEIIKTGRLKEIKVPGKYSNYLYSMSKLEKVFGIGSKLSYEYVSKYKIKDVSGLVKAHNKGIITLTKQMLVSIKYLDRYKTNILRTDMNKVDKVLHSVLSSDETNKLHVTICGSFRRLKMNSNDIDVLIVYKGTNYKNKNNNNDLGYILRQYIDKLKDINFIVDDLTFDKTSKMYMGYCTLNKGLVIMRIDIKIFLEESYYTALMYFTGSNSFNQKIRLLAKNLGYKLNEYGLYKNGKKLKINSEKDIFGELGLDYVSPENR